MKLSQETGGHRIQRVPPTERKGRVHTSTVTVAVIDPQLPKFELSEKDIRVEWFSGTGKGGQHRNKHQNSCRLIYEPTGLIVTAQCRSRQNSYDEALSTLTARLKTEFEQKVQQSQAMDRKNQVGSGQRGDKARTYRFQDDKVFDHESNKTAQCSKVLKGHFDLLWKK